MKFVILFYFFLLTINKVNASDSESSDCGSYVEDDCMIKCMNETNFNFYSNKDVISMSYTQGKIPSSSYNRLIECLDLCRNDRAIRVDENVEFLIAVSLFDV